MSRMRTRWAVALALVAVAAPAAAAAETTPVVSAHRALDVAGPAENSLAAFDLAVRRGETDVEGDAWLTKDGAFVMSHDSPLLGPRCAGPYLDVPLRALTAAQVAQMTCGGEPVARLTDVIEVVRPFPATLRIEVKHATADSAAVRTADAVRLARLLAASGMTGRSLLQDFSWASTTPAVLAASPQQRVSALSTTVTVAQLTSAAALGVDDFSYRQDASTSFWNRVAATKGLTSTVWTVNDPVRARVMRAQGVGTIISDVPSTLRSALDAEGSQCALTTYSTRAPVRTRTLAAGARTYPELPRRSPDGRVVETTLVRVTASTSSGTAVLQVGPQGTPYSATWERAVTVSTSARSSVVEVALGDNGRIRIRNTSGRAVTLAVSPVGGRAYTCD